MWECVGGRLSKYKCPIMKLQLLNEKLVSMYKVPNIIMYILDFIENFTCTLDKVDINRQIIPGSRSDEMA